jgi:hypothetical protein
MIGDSCLRIDMVLYIATRNRFGSRITSSLLEHMPMKDLKVLL